MSTILDIKTGGITDNKYAFGILVFILLTKCADLSPNISAFEKLHFLICSALTSFGVIPMMTGISWHLLVTFCTLHVAQRFNVFKTKAIDTETVMLFGILNDVSTGLLDLCLGFNSIGFYQMTKLAIIPFTVLSETLFLDKVCDSELCGSVRHQIVYHFVSLYLSLRKLITRIGADSALVYNFW
ncbi:UDP-xylose transporter 1-like isoform X3 [Papaver somniferum]|uniref:UDP-xylose transporter 1-like isoform X3 n=1 Tax=Papaver somniferum TaxID=3469 RepID=UPI000E6FC481|nr:UDP-xylose transporter 1-like isoform X3 [Papaver somniferum]